MIYWLTYVCITQGAPKRAGVETLALKKNQMLFFYFVSTISNDKAGYRCLPETGPIYFDSQIMNSFFL